MRLDQIDFVLVKRFIAERLKIKAKDIDFERDEAQLKVNFFITCFGEDFVGRLTAHMTRVAINACYGYTIFIEADDAYGYAYTHEQIDIEMESMVPLFLARKVSNDIVRHIREAQNRRAEVVECVAKGEEPPFDEDDDEENALELEEAMEYGQAQFDENGISRHRSLPNSDMF
ncbi:MAG: hypothetical protein M0003_12385 [Acidithiobacillus sp.]|nr:hypothetical protein [Acidithiobacillus sp.]